ncbi:MAG: hypothetical protein HY257_06800, partial [Chloroflexi bacterium]|nr:hypothetical protein [Chloroflexota bacterium]
MIRVWKILARINILFFFFAASSCVTREIPNSISAPTIAPAPTARVSLSPTATRAASSLPPSWWTLEIEMPATIEFSGDKNTAVWSTRDLNVKGLSDLLAAQGKNARYTVSIIARSVDAIYDVVFVKNGNAYGLNLTRGIARTVITGTRVGMIH